MEDRTLELPMVSYDEQDKIGEWARYIRHLFPNLNTEECLRYYRWESATAGWMAVLGRVPSLEVLTRSLRVGGAPHRAKSSRL